MDLKLVSESGAKTSKSIGLADSLFGQEFNEPLVHQVVNAYMAAGRAGTVGQKTRSDVRGGGAKPFKQKGSGRARAGTIRSPLWRGGGKVFAARNQDYSQKVNRKMYRGAISSILSELARQDRLMVIESFSVELPKTKSLLAKLDAMGLDNVLIVSDVLNQNLALAARNVARVEVAQPSQLNPVNLIKFEKVLMTSAAIKQLEEIFA
ncbi:MAG: 50S ribosomal protein L4 [Gammaproteobacteria bacterium]|nr:50S ribosomal protein L4 [Gammaproteobacteria bacterium]